VRSSGSSTTQAPSIASRKHRIIFNRSGWLDPGVFSRHAVWWPKVTYRVFARNLFPISLIQVDVNSFLIALIQSTWGSCRFGSGRIGGELSTCAACRRFGPNRLPQRRITQRRLFVFFMSPHFLSVSHEGFGLERVIQIPLRTICDARCSDPIQPRLYSLREG
jgi:hypothetical protein